ncbi:dihydrofolate reductase [Eupransor demetentiae]|uniref:Dihydrofolate reductase n=1 Tax=Eupransor demetentiae TaxID=3109584 RepID=A0ABM9N3X3_9LACO|nr:Dihydrofolate reductase (FolA) [Lactobacillaceae bacterium LMG 33000]
MQTIKMVWAEDDQHAIGRDGQLPWHIKADLALFKKETVGSIMIMGRSTWESIGRPLPNRQSVVLTRQKDFKTGFDQVKIFHSMPEVLAYIKGQQDMPITIAGGAAIYRAFMPYATDLVVTKVAGQHDGDTFVDPINTNDFKLISRQAQVEGEYHYQIERYTRVK